MSHIRCLRVDWIWIEYLQVSCLAGCTEYKSHLTSGTFCAAVCYVIFAAKERDASLGVHAYQNAVSIKYDVTDSPYVNNGSRCRLSYLWGSEKLALIFADSCLAGPNDGVLIFNTILSELQVAFTDGLQSPINPSAVTGFCPGGNCTFEDYSSLAIYSSAKDVTPTLSVDCPREYRETELGCSYNVPDLRQTPTWRKDNFTTTTHLGNTLWIGASQTNGDGFASGPGTLVEFYVLYFPDIKVLADNSGSNITASVVALKGSLDLCVKTYHTNVTNGITTTNVTNNQTNLNWHNVPSSQGSTAVTLISATAADGKIYWIEQNTRVYFNAFLEAAGFYGGYTGGVPQNPNLNTATSDTARAMGDKLYAVAPSGMAGLQALKKALANLETSMSNA